MGGGKILFIGLTMLFAFSIVAYVAKKILDDKKAKKAQLEANKAA